MKKSLKNFAGIFLLLNCCICAGSPKVYFTPNRKTDQIIIEFIDNARKSIYIASYTMSFNKIFNKLLEKKTFTDTKIMLDAEPSERLPEGMLKIDAKSSLFHAKFMVADGRKVLVSSGNFTETGLHSQHNNYVLIENSKVAEFFTGKFLSLWDGKPSEEIYVDETLEIYFAPETDCEAVIADIISSAVHSVRFAQYHFTSENIAKSVILRKLAGVDVRGIIERSSVEPHSVFYSLRDYGCGMKKSNLAGMLHDKFFIIDEKIVITGSYNVSASARQNTECLLVIKDREIAASFLKEWKRLWYYFSLS